jgi:hypothetical protein
VLKVPLVKTVLLELMVLKVPLVKTVLLELMVHLVVQVFLEQHRLVYYRITQ